MRKGRKVIEAAIFDFDGTLFDSMRVWDNAGEAYLSSFGIRAAEGLGEALKPMSVLQAAAYIRREYLPSVSEKDIALGINSVVEDAYRFSIMPKPGAPSFLRQLSARGVKMCIATAAEEKLVRCALERCSLQGFFRGIISCNSARGGKGSPLVYRAALSLLQSGRKEALVFEDALHAILCAKADGFIAVAVADPSEKRIAEARASADFFLEDYGHLDPFWEFFSKASSV